MLNITFCYSFPLHPLAACGGELNTPSGTISSPNYPNLYPHSRVCHWEIIVPQGRRVTLTINDLRLEDSGSSCVFDYVDVSSFLPVFPYVSSRHIQVKQDVVVCHHRIIGFIKLFMSQISSIHLKCI